MSNRLFAKRHRTGHDYISSHDNERKKKVIQVEKSEDYTKWLPNEIITTCILPRLPLKAAVRTSVLSRRWRNLWKDCIGKNLIFFDDIYSHRTFISDDYMKRPEAKQWWASYLQSVVLFVDCILKSYPHSTMDDFTLRLPFTKTHSSHIDRWLQFAFSKGIKRIELAPPIDLMLHTEAISECYVFPGEDKLSNWLLNGPVCSSPLTSYNNLLTDLRLANFEIHQTSISFIMSHCPFLEQLSINSCDNLVDLKVIGPSLRLRCLEIIDCILLKSIEISAPNLTLFKFRGPSLFRSEFAMYLKYVPRLSEVFIAGSHTLTVIKSFPQHYSYLSQLETLTLQLSERTLKKSISFPLEFPKLNKLKHLEVIMHVFSYYYCLLWPTSLIKAAPLLQRFTAKLRYNPNFYSVDAAMERRLGPGYENLVMPDEERERIQKATDHVHESLKVVELIGFICQPGDLELAHHLLGIAAKSLVKLVIDRKFASGDMQAIGAPARLTNWWPRWISKFGDLLERLPVGAKMAMIN